MFLKLGLIFYYLAAVFAQHYQPQYQQQYQQVQPQYEEAQIQYQQAQPQYQQAQPQYHQAQPQYQQENQLNLASPTPAQFPAGVDPKICPNYPDCSNPLVTVHAVLSAQQKPQPKPESQYPPEVQQKLDRGEYIGDGDYHGEGLDEALAPQALAASQEVNRQLVSAPQYYQPQYQLQYQPQPQPKAQPQPQQAARAFHPGPTAAQYSPQYITKPQYISSPGVQAGSQYQPASPYAQARLFNPGASSPQYSSQSAPVSESRSYNPVASASEPVQAVLLPAGVDASSCPNYPFCHS